ncbi:hypothetical protein VTN00DRAFT_6189 [Thermoascus crustaceus]|uniref:uncharacterized protein n=1 Tax=Thermoascus crustaceus TaxID=5088 RepID=UPI00374336E3
MGWPVCNTTLEDEIIDEIDLWDGGGMTFHNLGLIICAAFAITAIGVSVVLIMCHATHYSLPREQRHIIRILFMVPVYSTVAWLSFYYYRHAVYFEVMGNCYEAFTISAFFTLLCHYIAPDLHSQKEYFRGIKPKKWLWPVNWLERFWGGETGPWRTPRSGLTWFNIIWTGVFQYCLVRVLMTIVSVATQTVDLYCEESLNPAFSHIWVLVIESICVSIAMYCLVQFYVQLKDDISQYQPFLKIVSIKLVIFLSFWQTTLISFLTSSGAIKPTKRIYAQDLKIGIPNLLICIEMAIFAVMHIWAFPWRPYTLKQLAASIDSAEFYGGTLAYHGGFLGIMALIDAFNPWDLIKAIGRGFRWLFVGRKTRMLDPSYHLDQTHTLGHKPEGGSSETGTNSIAYSGAGAAMARGGSRRYYSPSHADEEGDDLLSNAQQPAASSYPMRSFTSIGLATSLNNNDLRNNHYYNELPTDSPIDPPTDRPHLYQPFHSSPYHSPYPAPADADDYKNNNPFDDTSQHRNEIGVTTTVTIAHSPSQHSVLTSPERDGNMPLPAPMPAPYLPPPLDDHNYNYQRR